MGVQFDRLRYEVFQNLFLSPMNTGLLRPAVATTPTVYGIETTFLEHRSRNYALQQHLPFTVLKLIIKTCDKHNFFSLQQHLPFTVLKPNDTSVPSGKIT